VNDEGASLVLSLLLDDGVLGRRPSLNGVWTTVEHGGVQGMVGLSERVRTYWYYHGWVISGLTSCRYVYGGATHQYVAAFRGTL
jgi:hypothetical protein